jgi:Zn-dependent protease
MRGLDPTTMLYVGLALVVAATIHEFAHAYVADRLGDPTPRAHGRLTLNPLAHLDPIGSLLILLAGFGWARPVPIDPTNFRDWRRDTIMVAAAGPLANITLLFLLGMPYKLELLPLDGGGLDRALRVMIQINAMLAVFNLLPVPPLDGSKILMGLLPAAQAITYARLQPYGVVVLLVLVLTDALGAVLVGPMRWLIAQATGGPY